MILEVRSLDLVGGKVRLSLGNILLGYSVESELQHGQDHMSIGLHVHKQAQ